MPAGFASLCFNCAEPGHVAGSCTGKRRCLNCKSEDHVAHQCTVAGAVAHGALPPPPRAMPAPPPSRAPPAPTRLAGGPLLPQPSAPPASSRDRPAVADAPSTVPYRVPACQRLGTVDAVAAPAPFPRPPIKEHLGVRDVDQVEAVSEETPFEHGVRCEWEIRAASPLPREEVEMGISLYTRGLRHEQELHAVALALVDALPVVTPRRRANWDILLADNPLDGRDFSLRFGVWNRQLQAMRRTFRFRVHLETDDPAAIPKAKLLWLAEPLLFKDEDDDLLLPVKALILEEVALLEFEAAVHLVRVEDTAASAGWPAPGGHPGGDLDRDDSGNGFNDNMGGAPVPFSSWKPPLASGRGVHDAGQVAPARRWRGGSERRVALGQTTSVLPWYSVQNMELGPRFGSTPAGRASQKALFQTLKSVVVVADKDQAPLPPVCSQRIRVLDLRGTEQVDEVERGSVVRPGSAPFMVASGDVDTVAVWESSSSIQASGQRWLPIVSPVP
ncbi:hypothetical protein ACQ4PT_041336 [Festuca glaucescens]